MYFLLYICPQMLFVVLTVTMIAVVMLECTVIYWLVIDCSGCVEFDLWIYSMDGSGFY